MQNYTSSNNEKVEYFTSAAMIPTPDIISERIARIYVSSCDRYNRARITYVDCDFSDSNVKVVSWKKEPFFDIGTPGTFDDNGCVATSIVTLENGIKYLYYVGFELCEKIRYRLFTGLAISRDEGKTFKKYSSVPVLDRTDNEKFFRCGPFVMLENGIFRLWYVAGNEWTEINGKQMPVYVIKYLESNDGINWGEHGKVCIDIEYEDEHGFGRPYVMHQDGKYQMFYCKRVKHLGYRMGYAESNDGIEWTRKDENINLNVSPSGWDSEMVCYPAAMHIMEKTLLLYNGNGFGKTGFGYAELKENNDCVMGWKKKGLIFTPSDLHK